MGTVHNTHLDLDEITNLAGTTMTYHDILAGNIRIFLGKMSSWAAWNGTNVVPGAGKGSAAPHAAVAEDDGDLRAAGGQENGLEHLP